VYKEAKTYKGFEAWYHALQMSFKMHLYCIIALLMLHLMIPALYFILFEPKLVGFFLNVLFSFQFQYIPKILKYFIKAGWFVFILATPIWLLYPILLRQFKKKSEAIVRDEHLRGTKLINDDELIKIIEKDIKERSKK